ncbi:GGDEF domain-containing protein [Mycetocola manganoxydans]|nr:diguanylate cyclase [Mycetocola manganoxydans]GHD41666.1 hypothetical protein GCM10008097_06660 [Mycetocola manganoxydans]
MNPNATSAVDGGGASVRQTQTAGLPDGLFASALEAVSEGSLITNAERRIIYANRAITEITGYSADEMMGKNCALLQGPETDAVTIQLMRDSFESGETFRGEILNYRKDGSPFWNSLTVTPIADASGTTTHFVSVQRDISPLIELQEQLRFQATHDPVTGLPNRTALAAHLAEALARGSRAGTALAVGMIDLDDFKRINDTYGHPVGDAVLREFAQRTRACIRSVDVVGRIGGDEFLAVFEGLDATQPLDDLRAVIDRLHEAHSQPISLDGGVELSMPLSMGVALAPAHGTTGVELFRIADEALYSVKSRKGTRSEWWEVAADA